MSFCVTCVQYPIEARRGHQIQNHMMWVLETESESSTRAVSAFNFRVISPVPDKTLLLYQDHV